MARRETEAEKVAHGEIQKAEAEIRAGSDTVEEIISSWAKDTIILDVKDDGEWSRHRWNPRDPIDAIVMSRMAGV